MASTYRATMADLIARVRSDIGDPAVPGNQFSDLQIQDTLDLYRTDVVLMDLLATPTYSGSSILYLNYYTNQGLGDWEADYTLWQYLYHQVTDNTALSEPLTGHWVFAATTLPPVFITGKTYDANMACWRLCMRWATSLARAYDFTSDGQSFHRNQAYKAMVEMAMTFKKAKRITSGVLVRSDITSEQTMDTGPQGIDYMASGDPGR